MRNCFVKPVAVLLGIAVLLSGTCVPASAAVTQYNDSWYINNKPTNSTTDDNPFVCFKGDNGVYNTPVTNYKDLSGGQHAWTDTGEKQPWMAPWFISATTGADGVISFIAPSDGTAQVKSSLPIKLDTSGGNGSDGLEFMIAQKSSQGYYPLFPEKGTWKWKTVDKSTNFALSDISTYLKTSDEILYIVRSTGTPVNDTLTIDPQVTFDKGGQEGGEYVHPTAWSVWKGGASAAGGSSSGGGSNPSGGNGNAGISGGSNTYNSSWYIDNLPTNSTSDNDPFVCLKGSNGVYTDPLSNRKDNVGGHHAWTDTNEKQPWVSPWFISATTGSDGVISFITPQNGTVEAKSQVELKLDTSGGDNSDGLNFMIVQKSKSGYYPLYPSAGQWKWKTFVKGTTATLSNVKTYVKAGDQVLFIVHSTGTNINDTLQIDPQVVFVQSESQSAGYSYPSGFVSWDNSKADFVDAKKVDINQQWKDAVAKLPTPSEKLAKAVNEQGGASTAVSAASGVNSTAAVPSVIRNHAPVMIGIIIGAVLLVGAGIAVMIVFVKKRNKKKSAP